MRKIHTSLLLKASTQVPSIHFRIHKLNLMLFQKHSWNWIRHAALLKKELFAAKVEKAFFSTMYGSSLRKLLKENCLFLLDFLTLLHSFSLYVFFSMHFWGSYCSVLPVIQYFLAKVNSWVHEHRFINCSKKGNLYDMIFFLLISSSENTEFL